MANGVSQVGFSDYAAEQQEIDRRKMLAQKLQEQSIQPQETQMAGGWAIPQSWTQGLAKALQGYGSYKVGEDAKTAQKALGEKSKAEMGDWLKAMPQSQTKDLNLVSMDDEGNAMPPAMQTTQPTQQQMMAWALKGGASGNPYAAQMAGPFLAQALKQGEGYTLAPGAVRMQGGQQVAAAPFKPDPAPAGFTLAPGATRYGPDGKVIAEQPAPAKEKWSEPYQMGGAWVQRNEDTGQIRQSVNRPPVTNVTTTVNTGADKKYLEERGKGMAQQMDALEKAAQSAHNNIQAMDRFIAGSKAGSQGSAQPVITGVKNLLSSFGYADKDLTDVRQMEQAIGDVLQNKMSELGARGLTDRDMDVLRQALPRVNTDKASRELVADIIKTSSMNTIQNYLGQRAEEERAYPEFASRVPAPAWLRGYQSKGSGGLSPAEQAELDQLRARYKKPTK